MSIPVVNSAVNYISDVADEAITKFKSIPVIGQIDYGKLFEGSNLMLTGALAIAAGLTILTCGGAAPIMVAVAGLTVAAGAATTINGMAEIGESVTGYNIVRDTVFGGNQEKYDIYKGVTRTTAEVGTMICGAYIESKGGQVCFVAGTLVLTAEGLVAIENINAGDIVIATNPETGETEEKRVLRTFVNETEELVHLTIDGEEITCTPGHKFYSPEKGWTSAIDLKAGDILVLVNGEYVTVEAVQHEILEAPVTIYNFEVKDFHTYHVGAQSVLVHNEACNLPKKDTVLDDDSFVVRGGQSKPDNLLQNQAKDLRGHISANSANDVSIDVLATTPNAFPNGKISIARVGDIRALGMDVIPDPHIGINPYHASIVPINTPMTVAEQEALSNVFEIVDNIWR